MRTPVVSIIAWALLASLPGAEDPAKQRDEIIARLQDGRHSPAGTVDELAALGGEQVLAALPAVLDWFAAHPPEPHAIDRLVLALRKVDTIIPAPLFQRVEDLAKRGSDDFFQLLRVDQAVKLEEARERAAIPPPGE